MSRQNQEQIASQLQRHAQPKGKELSGELAPTLPGERIVSIDLLRGFALLGILIVNIIGYATPQIYEEALNKTYDNYWDQWFYELISVAAQGKFYSLFSFLFGFGFIIFLQRAELKSNRPAIVFVRRMVILWIIGMLHAVLLWWGDILMTYAIGGLLLLLFYRSEPRRMLIWAVILLTVYTLVLSSAFMLASHTERLNPGSYSEGMSAVAEEYERKADSSYIAYGKGSFKDILKQRLTDLKVMLENMPFALLLVFPMFLLGAAAARLNWFQRAMHDVDWLRRIWWISLVAGAGLTWLKHWGKSGQSLLEPSAHDIWHVIGSVYGDPALCIFYMSSILWLCRKPAWLKLSRHVALAGRMSLTHYLMQSIICTTLFYSYGLGLYGQLGPGLLLILAFVIYSVQLILSVLWFKRFNYGPMEWLWRKGTYLQ